nr:T9SS type A sorting domain-containing protein [Hymenobacter nitidus]
MHRYEALDQQPVNQLAYYRLKQVDQDGTTAFSPIATVQAAQEVVVFPNPVQHILTIQVPPTQGEKMPVQLTDLSGRVMLTSTVGHDGQLDMRALQPGTYLLHVGAGTTRMVQKIVKE